MKPPLPVTKVPVTKEAAPSAAEIDLFPDEEDAFYQEISTYVGDVNDSGDELENSYAGTVLSRHSHEDEAGDKAEEVPEDGDSQADLEELPEEEPEPEESVTQPGTPVSPHPGDWGTSSPEPEPEKVTPEAVKLPQLPDKEAEHAGGGGPSAKSGGRRPRRSQPRTGGSRRTRTAGPTRPPSIGSGPGP